MSGKGGYGKGYGNGGHGKGGRTGDWRDKLSEKEEIEYTKNPVDCCVVASETEPFGMGIPGLKINYDLKEAMHDMTVPDNPYKRLFKCGTAPRKAAAIGRTSRRKSTTRRSTRSWTRRSSWPCGRTRAW